MDTSLLLLATLAALIASGCNRSLATTEHREHEHTPAATYKEGHGLRLSAAGVAFTQLKVDGVALRDVGGSSVTAIPADALVRTIKGDFVYVANGEWFLRTPVKLARAERGWLEVADGLYEGDKIVVAGAGTLWLAEIHAVNGGVGCAHGH